MFLVRKMNQIRRILLFGCFFSTIFNIKAYDFEHEKIYYKITSESEATVGVDRGTTEYIGKIVIPKKFKVEMEFLLLDRVERLLGHLWLIIQRRIE